jgi:hypothetical protein
MGVLALAVIPALLLDDGDATPRVHFLAMSINWWARRSESDPFAAQKVIHLRA